MEYGNYLLLEMHCDDRSNMSVALIIWEKIKSCEKQRWKQATNDNDIDNMLNFLKTMIDEIFN